MIFEVEVIYEELTVWLVCEKRGADKFRYNAQRDTGNYKCKSKFYIDKDVSPVVRG